MSAHCHHCGADLVYVGEWPNMECPACHSAELYRQLNEAYKSLHADRERLRGALDLIAHWRGEFQVADAARMRAIAREAMDAKD